MIFKQLQK